MGRCFWWEKDVCNKHSLDNKDFLLSEKEQKEFELYLSLKTQSNSFDLKKLRVISEYLIKLISISTIFGILYGFIISFNYLKEINHLFILPEIIGTPSSLLALLLFPVLSLLLISLLFLSCYFINNLILSLIPQIDYIVLPNKNINYFFVPIFHLIFSLILCTIYFFDYYIFGYDKNYTIIVLLSNYILLNIIIFNCLKSEIQATFLSKFFGLSAIAKIIFSFFLFSGIFVFSTTAKNYISQLATLALLLIALVMVEFISCLDLQDKIFKKNNKSNKLWLMPIIIAFYVVILIAYQFFVDIQGNSLYMVRYVEKPQNSSWYLIHNGNNTSKIINGLTKTNIKNYKHVFEPNSWREICKEDVFTNTNMSNCSMLDEYVKDMNDNALYGYMTWNLGSTKVFCPQSVDFFADNGDNKEKSEKCLVIDGKYLQPISEHYLAN